MFLTGISCKFCRGNWVVRKEGRPLKLKGRESEKLHGYLELVCYIMTPTGRKYWYFSASDWTKNIWNCAPTDKWIADYSCILVLMVDSIYTCRESRQSPTYEAYSRSRRYSISTPWTHAFSILPILLVKENLFGISDIFNMQVKVQITVLLPVLCKALFTEQSFWRYSPKQIKDSKNRIHNWIWGLWRSRWNQAWRIFSTAISHISSWYIKPVGALDL